MKATTHADAGMAAGSSARGGAFGAALDADGWFQRLRRAEDALAPDAAIGRLGEYDLLGIAGRGGQGIVYKARQPRTGRSVALKRLAAGAFSTPEMRARFEREIEVAAALDHPNVVTVFGSERLDDQLVLAMQWIDGVPFDRWARDGGMAECGIDPSHVPTFPPSHLPTLRPIRFVLDAFVKICDAVHHAHQRGVIHRDLKPSNILVDRNGDPHVLDFGLAKLEVSGDSQSGLTLTNGPLGTPAFAPPEILRGALREVDVRSDVYSLGVVLYQALTGRLPHEPAFDWVRFIDKVQSREPPAASSLDARIDRELDAILSRALAKEKARRYESVDAFSADVQRYLRGEAVDAHPPSRLYRLRKLLRRHWMSVTLGAAALLVLIGGAATVLVFYFQAAAADQKSTREADKQRQIAQFYFDLINNSDPGSGQGTVAMTVRQALDVGAQRLERGDKGYLPEVEVLLRLNVANSLMAHGDNPAGLRLARGAADIARLKIGEQTDEYVDSLLMVARAGMPNETDALRTAIRVCEGLPGDHRAQLAQMCHYLNAALRRLDDLAGAEAAARRTHELSLALWRDGWPEYPAHGASFLLGQTLALDGPEMEAERLLTLGNGNDFRQLPKDRNAAIGAAFTAQVRGGRGDLVGGMDLIEKGLAIQREFYGDEHPDTATMLIIQAGILHLQGSLSEAEAIVRQAIDIRRRLTQTPDNNDVDAGMVLGRVLRDAGRLAEAETAQLDTLALCSTLYVPLHRYILTAKAELARTQAAAGRDAEAEALFREVLAARRTLPETSRNLATSLHDLGDFLASRGQLDESEPLLIDSLERRRTILWSENPELAKTLLALASVQQRLGNAENAEPMAREGLEILVKRLPPAHPSIGKAKLVLDLIHAAHGEP